MNVEFDKILHEDKIFQSTELSKVLKELTIKDMLGLVEGAKKTLYYNVPTAFDIETSSIIYNEEKAAFMYIWQFGIGGYVIIGREWNEFKDLIYKLVDYLGLDEKTRLIIYVHNLSYEFQFIRKLFNFESVFSMENRKPIKASMSCGIEFRCSYYLTNKSLFNVGEDLIKYKVEKQVGSLDYKKVRHSKTPLTDEELKYCIDDVKVVMACIQEKIDIDGSITKIPLTNTGYVRIKCRESCLRSGKNYNRKYRELIKSLTLEPDEYIQLKNAFQGGFTHANPYLVDETLNNVCSFDFTSSYPGVMVCEKFPLSKGERVSIHNKKEFIHYLNYYCCLFDCKIEGLEPKINFENYLSFHKCRRVSKNRTLSNGRIVRADYLETTLTDVDYWILEKFYKWKRFRVCNFRFYKKGYLPTDFIKVLLELYKDKTELKGVEEKIIDYMVSKGMVNACFGMTVTDIVRPEIIYDDDWQEEKIPYLLEAIKKYNKDSKRFLFYPWGVWITAYARKNLFTGILEFNYDYVYSDTDSIKGLNREKHMEYIESYNKKIERKMINAMKHHNLPLDSWKPKNIKGEEKPLGFWDYEGYYTRFKTLGAKRYMVERNKNKIKEDEDPIVITVSGLKKKDTIEYLRTLDKDPFELFRKDLLIPPGCTGKLTHTYIDKRCKGKVKDYLGIEGEFNELSCVHLEDASYKITLSDDFITYINSLIYER